MSGVRIYDLAKELNVSSNEILDMLKEMGEPARTPSSTLPDQIITTLRQRTGAAPVPVSNGAAKPVSAGNGTANGTSNGASAPSAASAPVAAESAAPIDIPEIITLKDFAHLIGIPATDIQKKLMGLGVLASLNQKLSPEVTTRLAKSYKVSITINSAPKPAAVNGTAPEAAPTAPKVAVVAPKPRQKAAGPVTRPPVVTIMGHVDHGKTSLLDAIRQAKVASGEYGGITQHIGAYQVEVDDPENKGQKRKITFLDTPGHEAFTAMRARGAQVTDIAVLVVAADDGVMPQTIEAINHAKAAGVPIIVAVNKIDKEGANPTNVLTQLTQYDVMPEAYGGNVQTVEVSAKEKLGLDDLLEQILLVTDAEIEPKADPSAPATGTVIEAELDKGRGAVATILVDQGTLKMGDSIVAGGTFGRIKAMLNDRGQRVTSATPATPVVVLGLGSVPAAGDRMEVVKDEKAARQLAEGRAATTRDEKLNTRRPVTLEDLQKQFKDGASKELNLIIKGDVQGSVEAIRQSLEKIQHSEVKVRFISSGVGAVSDSDVLLASASSALIVAFNTKAETAAQRLAEAEHVEIREYRVIYDLIDDVKLAMAGLLDPIYEEIPLGTAEVRAVFKLPRSGGSIAGSYILSGKVVRGGLVRVRRGGKLVAEGKIETLKREKDDVREVAQGYECGILVPGYDPMEPVNDRPQDTIECYEMKRTIRTL
ncbi:MAG: translation initiation factor IF-2 [Janthinobacterium lividum]